MRPHAVSSDEARHAAASINARETSAAEWARTNGVSRTALYNAIKREGLSVDLNVSAQEHLELQRKSGLPPEVYAYRAAIPIGTLRRWAGEQGLPIAMSGYAEKKEWWVQALSTYTHATARTFCAANNLSVALVATWYHMVHQPAATLLWGFEETLELRTDQFDDIYRWEQRGTELFALGRGRYAAPISETNAGKILATLTQH